MRTALLLPTALLTVVARSRGPSPWLDSGRAAWTRPVRLARAWNTPTPRSRAPPRKGAGRWPPLGSSQLYLRRSGAWLPGVSGAARRACRAWCRIRVRKARHQASGRAGSSAAARQSAPA
eukprot:scaffold4136_cov101-Isochrysis_galbana.AAC.1